MNITTEKIDGEYISAAPNMKYIEYKLDLLIPPAANHSFSKNEALDSKILHRRL